MNSNKIKQLFSSDAKIYLWIIALLILLLALYEPILLIGGILLIAYLIYFNRKTSNKKNRDWQEYIRSLSTNMDSAARHSILNLPIPLILLDSEGKVNWCNQTFFEISGVEDPIGVNIEKLLSGLSYDKLLEQNEFQDIKLGEKYFQVLSSSVDIDKRAGASYITMLYCLDRTQYYELKTLHEDERAAMAIIQVDNMQDVLKETKEEHRPSVYSEVDKKITLWATRMNAMIKKYTNDKYIVIFAHKFLNNLEAKRFSLLDDIREIEVGNKIPITLSMGVASDGNGYSQIEKNAFSALELALGRGGDQAVVKKESNYEFYGGKTKAVEKRNRVKARVIAHAFKPLVEECSQVFIMGHKYPDMDAFGSAIGVYRAVLNCGRDAYIVLNDVNDSIINVYNVFAKDDTYKFISTNKAQELIDENSLIVVVDTHKPSFTEAPELLETGVKIVLIDHHRRGAEFIDEAVLKYTEPYASSASELVTEILQYMDDDVRLDQREAEALLAGIIVDTKNFTIQTGVRTFDAASLLRRFGADTMNVRQLFQDDLNTFIQKSDIVRCAEIFDRDVAISVYDTPSVNAQLIGAQGADALLSIRGISTSFVIGQTDEHLVFISGRSLSDVNVQVILEKLGGGGHMSVAGAQFSDKTPQEAKELLLGAIDEYFQQEGENV